MICFCKTAEVITMEHVLQLHGDEFSSRLVMLYSKIFRYLEF